MSSLLLVMLDPHRGWSSRLMPQPISRFCFTHNRTSFNPETLTQALSVTPSPRSNITIAFSWQALSSQSPVPNPHCPLPPHHPARHTSHPTNSTTQKPQTQTTP